MRQLCVALLHHIDSCRLGKRKKKNYLHGLKKKPSISTSSCDRDLQLMDVIVFDVDVEAVLLQ